MQLDLGRGPVLPRCACTVRDRDDLGALSGITRHVFIAHIPFPFVCLLQLLSTCFCAFSICPLRALFIPGSLSSLFSTLKDQFPF